MQDAASVLTDQFTDLLTRLPAGLDLDALALETKAIQRKREVSDGASLLRLALAYGPGGLSLRQASAWASMLGLAELSNPGVKYRLNQAANFLAAVIERLLAAKTPGANLRWPGRTLRLADGTCISKPGSKGTDWRVHGVFDLGCGGFSHLELTDKHAAEALERGVPLAGEIRIGDRNYARAPVLQRFREQSANQADFIVRVGWNAFQLSSPEGKAFDLVGHLGGLPRDAQPHEINLCAAAGRHKAPLPLRLIILRKTPEATEATRTALRRAAIKKGKTLDPNSLVAAEFMILGTSLPKEGYEAMDILAVYRLRWQIELAFKRLKSLLHIDRLPTRSERGANADREVGSMPTSFSPCCATISARISWTLPPEDLSDAAYIPSLWAVQKTALLVLVSVVVGRLSLAGFLGAEPQVHRRLANAPRKRKIPVRYPVRGLI